MSAMSTIDILVGEYLNAVQYHKSKDKVAAAYASLVKACGGSERLAIDIIREYQEESHG